MTATAAGTVHALADEALGNTSYIVDVGSGLAASVDPRRDVEDHIALGRPSRASSSWPDWKRICTPTS